MKKAVLAPIEKRGQGIVYSSWTPSTDEAKDLALTTVPYGGRWADFIGAECLKKRDWPDSQIVLSLTFVSRQEDEFSRPGTLHSRVLIISVLDYLALLRTGPLGIRQLFREEFSNLERYLPRDLSDSIEALPKMGRGVAEGSKLSSLQLARVAFDLQRYHRVVLAGPYVDPRQWVAVEQTILDLLQTLPDERIAELSFTSLATSMQDPSDIVGLPQQSLRGRAPEYVIPLGTDDVARSPGAKICRLVGDLLFVVYWLLGRV